MFCCEKTGLGHGVCTGVEVVGVVYIEMVRFLGGVVGGGFGRSRRLGCVGLRLNR